MNARKIGHILLSGIFLLQVLAMAVSLPELVLCVAEDHVRLEVQNDPATCSHSTTETLSISVLQQNYHQDRCNDIPLFQHSQQVHLQKQRLVLALQAAVLPPFLFDKNKTTARPQIETAESVSISSPQHALRSVILLI